jgi:hypothetical protein
MRKTYLKGLLAPFCSSSKRYQIPFGSLQKGIRYRMQNQKNPRKSNSIACGSRIPSCSLQKGCWLPLELLQKVIKYPLEQIACGNLRIACNADNVINIQLRGLNLKIKKYRQVLKLCLPSAVFITMRDYRTKPLSGRSNLVRRYL